MTSTTTPRSARLRRPRLGTTGGVLPRLLERWRPDVRAAAALGLPRSESSLSHYDRMLAAEAHVAGVPADLLRAICWHASGWRQFEPSGRVLATPAPQGSCYGCMQLNDVWHPDAFPAAMTDAQASIRYAANLLNWLHEQTGDWERATVAFFGHDRRAELSARRVRRYVDQRPWASHTLVVTDPEPDADRHAVNA